jgi:GMP synthase (glutamine-hydrolysing)
MEEVLIFQHDPFEDLGFFGEIFEKRKTAFRSIRLFHGETPDQGWDRIRALVILGGPMNARDEHLFPFLRWEKTIIRAAIEDDVPMLGICLGAQLIASAVGGSVYPGAVKEFGWYPVSITPEGRVDSLLGYLPEKPIVFQWHRDGFDLPAGALRLASSVYFDNQAFRLGRAVYGLQFHLQVTPQMISRWIDERSKDLAQFPYVSPDKLIADTRSYFPALKYYGERVLTEFLRRATSTRKTKNVASQLRP